jgi:Helix-turn-helix of DDE superfamily endonuclease
VAYLRKGETYADLACGFRIGTSTVYRYVREALALLAAIAPTLAQAMEVARGKAFVILDGTLLRIDRVGMASGRDRAFYSGKHKAHGLSGPPFPGATPAPSGDRSDPSQYCRESTFLPGPAPVTDALPGTG